MASPDTVTVGLDPHKRYPDLTILTEGDFGFAWAAKVEIPAETLAHWREVIDAYTAVQADMATALAQAEAAIARRIREAVSDG